MSAVFGIIVDLLVNKRTEALEKKIESIASSLPAATVKHVISSTLDAELAAKMLGSSLNSRCGSEESASSLLKIFNRTLSSDRLIWESRVTLSFRPVSQGQYALSIREDCIIPTTWDEVIIVLLNNIHSIQAVSNYSLDIDKIYVLPNQVSIYDDKAATDIVNLRSGDGVVSDFEVSLLSEAQSKNYLSDIGVKCADYSEFRIMKVALSKDKEKNRVIFEFNSIETISDGYCYWTPDRPAFVRDIMIDYTALSSEIKNVRTIECLWNENIAKDDNKKGKVNYWINDWLMPGHGVVLKWEG
ncbi:hypothetical protein LIHA111178_05860 [Litorimonas haliclonae]